MLSINKGLRKLGIISVSALMLLSVGGGAMNAMNTNVHAESLAQMEAGAEKSDQEDELKEWGSKQEVAKRKAEDQAYNSGNWSKYNKLIKSDKIANSEDTNGYGNSNVAPKPHNNNIPKSKRIPSRKNIPTLPKHNVNHHAKSSNLVPSNKKNLSKVRNRVNNRIKKDKIIRKHVNKHSKRTSLKEQIKLLRRELHHLNNQIKRLEHK